MSRGGYRKLERKLMQEDLQKLQEAAKVDPTIVVRTPPPPPHHRKWKEGRRNKGGGFINTTVEGVVTKIDELVQQTEEGSFTPTGRMDILATAIGKLDHPGQVRGSQREWVCLDILDDGILDLVKKSLFRRLQRM
ncbi:hypothetical protein K1719_035026 [Acacia pycnantha]|nr:hypothetical protein K1719_035026 [Acacia pycnantha]